MMAVLWTALVDLIVTLLYEHFLQMEWSGSDYLVSFTFFSCYHYSARILPRF